MKVVSEGPIGGVLRYALPGIGVTGVGASQPVRDALFPVRQEGGLDTAAAIRNLTESDLVVTCRLMKDGAVLEETQIPLAANGQKARYIEEMFTFTGADVSDFVGSVRCTVPPGEAMFTGVVEVLPTALHGSFRGGGDVHRSGRGSSSRARCCQPHLYNTAGGASGESGGFSYNKCT